MIVANHASHLDMGVIKHALGHREIVALAAKDYFFDKPWRRWFFTSFTNLIPFNRRTRLKESLQAAGEVLEDCRPLLLFPEGTRSLDGKMLTFKPSLGYLALNYKADVLPMYLTGVREAMPKGAWRPRCRDLGARIGPLVSYETLRVLTQGLSSTEAYRAATAHVEEQVRLLEAKAAQGKTCAAR